MAKETQKPAVTEVRAFARGIHISPRKVRLVADLLKKLPVAAALQQLDFAAKKAAGPLKKLVDSAVASATHNFSIDSDRLFVKSLTVDGGRVFFRYQPRAQGRALPVRKRTSHINLILGVASRPFKTRQVRKIEPTPQTPAPAAGAKEPKPKYEEPKKKSRFAFWKNLKGKKYTAFDRRSGS